jgi:hypothetical protein
MHDDQMTVQEGCLLLLFLPLTLGSALIRWLRRVGEKMLDNPLIGAPIFIGFILFGELHSWRHPAKYLLREDLFHQQSPWLRLDLSHWVRFDNRTQTTIRVHARDVEGWCPPQFRDQGMLLRPGQKIKFKVSYRHSSKYILDFSREGGDSCFIVVAPDPYA